MRKGEEGTELPMQPIPWFRGLAFPLVSKLHGGEGICRLLDLRHGIGEQLQGVAIFLVVSHQYGSIGPFLRVLPNTRDRGETSPKSSAAATACCGGAGSR